VGALCRVHAEPSVKELQAV